MSPTAEDVPVVAPFGTWDSPLSPERAAAAGGRYSALLLQRVGDTPVICWTESRPAQKGATVLVGAVPGRQRVDLSDTTWSIRSRVNEYGGGAVTAEVIDDSTLRYYAVAETGQRIGTADVQLTSDALRRTTTPRRLTPTAPVGTTVSHAFGEVAPGGRWLVVESERRPDQGATESIHELVAVDTTSLRSVALVGPDLPGGGDFVGDPRVSPDGRRLSWLRWDHPDMPWDAAELWVGELVLGDLPAVSGARRVAGGRAGGAALGLQRAVSVCLPRWSPDGGLWWCDDSDDWWRLHTLGPDVLAPGGPIVEGAGDDPSTACAVPPPNGRVDVREEVGEPRWVAGGSRYGFTADGRVVFVASSAGLDGLWVWDPATGERHALGPDLVSIEHLAVAGDGVAVIGGTGDRPNTVWYLDLTDGSVEDLRPIDAPLEPEWVSMPRSVTFPSGPSLGADPDGPVAHALFYPPSSGDHVGPAGTAPPLVVRIHGGPTAAARPEFSPSVQFWTTRGFAVAEVNYRGSVGYGRRYRDSLNGQWGVADVQDCIALTRHLARDGSVDPYRCVIRGGSSGGFTALAAVCFQRSWGAPGAFAAACSLYGVTDLAALAAGTHKFEARYLDGLVAPLPEGEEVYRERSPLHHAQFLETPILLLQGGRDRIVPQEQAELLVDALEANGVTHEYVLFPDEGHGFVSARTVIEALEAELAFYTDVLGLLR